MRTSPCAFLGALAAAGALVSCIGVAGAAASPTSATARPESAPTAAIAVAIERPRTDPLTDWWW